MQVIRLYPAAESGHPSKVCDQPHREQEERDKMFCLCFAKTCKARNFGYRSLHRHEGISRARLRYRWTNQDGGYEVFDGNSPLLTFDNLAPCSLLEELALRDDCLCPRTLSNSDFNHMICFSLLS